MSAISTLSIAGFRSIRKLENLHLSNLNVLIGANGSGKSNFTIQSVALLNEFEIDDLIVADREEGGSVFKRLDEAEFTAWLEDYTIGELWQKNILGGRPSR